MTMMTDSTASRVVASIPIWFVVFLVVVFGGFTFGSSDDWRETTLGAVLLAVAAVLSALIRFCEKARRSSRVLGGAADDVILAVKISPDQDLHGSAGQDSTQTRQSSGVLNA